MNVTTGILRSGSVLANVRYKWIINGVSGAEQNASITQPDVRFPLFRIGVSSPVGAEELILYDITDSSNWNTVDVL